MGEARNIDNAACAQIAGVLAPDGFEYRPSKHTLIRRNGDLTRDHTDDLITAGQIGNLQAKPKWLEFNLASPHRRDRVVGEVIGLIRTIALPYLERFSSPQEIIAGLIAGTMPWWWEPSALEYVACFGTLSQAQELLGRYVHMRPGQAKEFRERLDEYRKEGIPEAFDSRAAGRLAKAALALGLEPLE